MRRLATITAALAVVTIAAMAGLVAWKLWPEPRPRSEVPVAMQAAINAQTAAAVAAHGQDQWCVSVLGAGGVCSERCTASVFGIDPRSARSVAAVRVAYADVVCRETDSDGVDGAGDDVDAITFGPDGSAALISGPGDDATAADIARVFPSHVRNAAWWYYTHPQSAG